MALLKSDPSTPRCSYQVFLSFRGRDTRKGFTDHLYTALRREGFHTFRGDDEINRGGDISLEILQAIRNSKISIVVLSDHYAASKWCLDELVSIMERRRSGGQIVMPVFYHLTVSQVKQQSGSFAEAFAAYEKDHKDRVERWRTALREVADLAGFVLQDGYESELIQSIVEEVGKKLRCQLLNVPFHLVGRDSIIRRINSWIQVGSDDASIAVLCGMGGIGKTTIAKIAFNMNLNNFEGRSFIADVREVSKQPNGLVRLQRQFLSDLLKTKAEKINSAHEGIIRIKNMVCCKRVLLVLDDVDDLDQFHAIVQSKKWFYPGSRIIITTRNESIVRPEDMDATFRVEELDDEKSLQLLSWHAFGQDCPKEGFEQHSINMVKHCAGLPLALQVLGSSLVGKSVEVWESALQKLKMVMNDKIQGILRVSYDSLQDDYDKDLFLDIACFFIGMDIDYVVTILQATHSFLIVGLQNLMDRCLVTTNDKNKLKMHELIRGMAREIDHRRSHEDPRRHSRLWSNEDFIHVLRENKQDTESITGVALNFLKTMEESYPSDRLMLQFRQKCRRISFLNHKSVQSSPTRSFSTKIFRNMKKLRFLHLSNVNLTGCYDNFPKSLSWLRWDGFHSSALPSALCQQNLVVLDMQHSNLEYFWKGIKFLEELKILNLSHSHALLKTPNFKGLPTLQQLILKGCINLVEIDESIVDLHRLAAFNLKNCKSLRVLPARINMLKSLENINLSGCINLSEPPEVKQAFSCNRGLKKLMSLRPLHSVFMYWLFPRRGAQLPRFPLSFLPRNLVSLSLAGCNISDSAIPMDLSCFYFLRHLDLSRNPICSLPESLTNLSMLESLNVSSCDNLRTIPVLPASLETLWALFCKSLVRVGNCANAIFSGEAVKLGLYGCEKLVEIEGWFKSEPISNKHREILHSLGLPNLESVENMEVAMGSCQRYQRHKTSVQVLHQYGISSIFLPGDEVPKWFSHQNKGPLFSFVVPAAANDNILGFGLCIAYAFDARKTYRALFVVISNKTKGLKWTFRPQFFGVSDSSHELMLWLSLWKFREEELEAGDEMEVSMNLSFGVTVKEIGIRLVHQHEDHGATHSDGIERLRVWNEESITKADPNVWYFQNLTGCTNLKEIGSSVLVVQETTICIAEWK